MRIEGVEVTHVRLPLKEPFQISSGALAAKDSLIVKVWAEGHVGYGESPCERTPHYSYETTQTALHVIKDFVLPRIVKVEFERVGDLFERVRFIRGHNMARSGVEMAVWDLVARARGVSLCTLFGGVRTAVPTGVSVGIKPSVPELLERIGSFLVEGYQRVKVKVQPGWDVEVVKAIREEFGQIPLMVDANSAYSLHDLDLFLALDEWQLLMIEQPLHYDDIVDHAVLQAQIRTPICLDESIRSAEDARKAIELGSCKIVNIKLSRVGGLAETKRIHDLCEGENVPVWCGSMLESGVGEAHNLAMATLPNFRIQGDIAPSNRYFEEDIITPRIRLNPDGTIDVPQGPGIGVEIDEEKLQRYTVSSFRVTQRSGRAEFGGWEQDVTCEGSHGERTNSVGGSGDSAQAG